MKKIILFTVILFSTSFFGQPGSIDLSFNSLDTGFNNAIEADGRVITSIIQSDGKIIIGGEFTSYDLTDRNGIARLNANGTLDTTFNPGTGPSINNFINTISIQSDGKIIIGGDFTSFNGTSTNKIARLNSNGTVDTTFNPGTGANGSVYITSIQSDGKIIIGGDFTFYNGTSTNRIARLNSNGTLDTTFNLGTGANGSVLTSSIQSDGKIIIGGNFTSYSGTSTNRIVRLNTNGTIDTNFNQAGFIGLNELVRTTIIQSDGKIIVGGDFTRFNTTSLLQGFNRNKIARLNIDGTIDTTFNPGTGSNDSVLTTSIQSDGKIIIGGNFTSYNGTSTNRIARLNSNGTLDTTFNLGTGANGSVLTSSIQSDGKIIIGGNFNFTSFNGTLTDRITRLNTNGIVDTSFNAGMGANFAVLTTSIQSDGKIIIGGAFLFYNEASINRIARLNTNGTLDNTFNSGTGADGIVRTTKIQSDGKIIIGGDFTSYDGTPRNGIARLNTNGSLDTTFNPGTGANGPILTSSIQNDGKIIIGGAFNTFNGTITNKIARLNANGTIDTTFNPGTELNNSVLTTSIQSDGKIIVGSASYINLTGNDNYWITRRNTNGTLDNSFTTSLNIWGLGSIGSVTCSAIQNDGKILIGKTFTYTNSSTSYSIERLNANGTTDDSFSSQFVNGPIYTISIQSNGKIIFSGSFNQLNPNAGTVNNQRILRLNSNGTRDLTFIAGTGPASNYPIVGSVHTSSIQSDGKIIIGGNFNKYNVTGRNRIARINGDSTLSNPSFDLSTTVIYPNPSNGYFNVKIDDLIGTKNIEVYSVLGQKIYSKSIVENESSIDLSNQPKGIYFYKISDNNIVIKSGKLIIE